MLLLLLIRQWQDEDVSLLGLPFECYFSLAVNSDSLVPQWFAGDMPLISMYHTSACWAIDSLIDLWRTDGQAGGGGGKVLSVCECMFVLKNDYKAFPVLFFSLQKKKQTCCKCANSKNLSCCTSPRSAVTTSQTQLDHYKWDTSTMWHWL